MSHPQGRGRDIILAAPRERMPRWRNWQTRRTQNSLGLIAPCGFDSRPRHQLSASFVPNFGFESIRAPWRTTVLFNSTLQKGRTSTTRMIVEEVCWKNLRFVVGKRSDILHYIVDRVGNGERLFIVTANAPILDLFLSNEGYRECLESAHLLTVDGVGAAYLLRKEFGVKTQRYPGVEMMKDLCGIAQSRRWRVFLLGGRPGVAERAGEMLKKDYPSLLIAGTMHGYFDESQNAAVADQIRLNKTDLLFVAMGVPKQEFFIRDHFGDLQVKLAVGVGGAFDVISGVKRRAPRLIRVMGLEWFYRIVLEPRKRARSFFSVVRFAIRVWKGDIT